MGSCSQNYFPGWLNREIPLLLWFRFLSSQAGWVSFWLSKPGWMKLQALIPSKHPTYLGWCCCCTFFSLMYIFILFTGENPLKEHTHAQKTESNTKNNSCLCASSLLLSSRHLHNSQLEFIEAHGCHPANQLYKTKKEGKIRRNMKKKKTSSLSKFWNTTQEFSLRQEFFLTGKSSFILASHSIKRTQKVFLFIF